MLAAPALRAARAAALPGCGILAHGFARVHCFESGKDEPIAFSCKGRGFCPSCGGKRKWILRIQDALVARKILEHLGRDGATPRLAPARSPPQLAFAW